MKISQYTVVARGDLGQTRISNYLAYNHLSSDNSFDEITPKEMARLIKENKCNGLRLDEHGEIQLDESFNQRNLVIKSASRYRNMIENGRGTTGYSVIRKYLNDDGASYELVTSRCGRFSCSTEKLLMLCNFADVAGVRIKDGSVIELCEGVEIIDIRTSNRDYTDPDEVVDVGGQLMKVSELDDLTPEDLFGTGQEEKVEGLEVITDAPEPEKPEPVTPEVMEKPAPVKKPASKGSAKKK